MEKRNNEGGDLSLSMWRYACYIVIAIVLLSGAVLLLVSCEKEVPDEKQGSGNKVTVNIAVRETAYSGDLRGAGMPQEPETVIVPVEGELFMYATLEPVREEPERVLVPLDEGVRLMIKAYKKVGGGFETTATESLAYTMTSGSLVADGGRNLSVPGGEYRFVAYSFNKTDYLPDGESHQNIDPTYDLLWGQTEVDVDASPNVDLPVSHLFSQVTFIASTHPTTVDAMSTPVIADMSATITAHGATLKVQDGTLNTAGKISAGLGFTKDNTLSVDTTWRSVPRTVWINNSNETPVSIASVTLKDAQTNNINTMENLEANFQTKLLPGKKYNVKVTFKLIRFAGSNIIWTGNALNFSAYVTNTYSQRQGVFFKWGSLVGISPAKSMTVLAGSVDFFVAERTSPFDIVTVPTPLYIAGSSTPTYLYENLLLGWGLWTEPGSLGDALSIPYYDISYAASNNTPSNNYVNAQSNTTYRGDICRHINSDYRMPTAQELCAVASITYTSPGSSATSKYGWRVYGYSNFTDDTSLGNATGTSSLSSGAQTYRGIIFPASGFRHSGGGLIDHIILTAQPGQLSSTGLHGLYWSSSAASSTEAYALHITREGVQYERLLRSFAFPVRCVMNN